MRSIFPGHLLTLPESSFFLIVAAMQVACCLFYFAPKVLIQRG